MDDICSSFLAIHYKTEIVWNEMQKKIKLKLLFSENEWHWVSHRNVSFWDTN